MWIIAAAFLLGVLFGAGVVLVGLIFIEKHPEPVSGPYYPNRLTRGSYPHEIKAAKP